MRLPSVRVLAPSVVLAVAAVLAGCAPAPIYQNTPHTQAITPTQAVQESARYSQSDVIWGGRIVQTRVLADHSEIEVLAYPLDSSQRPETDDSGTGRFIIMMNGYVEPLDYPAGSLITVMGRLEAPRPGKVGNADYLFAVVHALHSHVWTAEEMRKGHPNINFGVGVGVGIR